jgi:exonuclease SbcD
MYQGKVEKGGANARFLDFVKTFQQSIDYIVSNKMDFCLIPGDIFRTKNPGPDELDAFSEGILKLIENEIPTVVVLGNHDVFMSDRRSYSIMAVDRIINFLQRSAKIKSDSFVLSSKPEIVSLNIKGQKVQVQTMPYPIRSLLRLENVKEVEQYMVQTINDVYETRDKNAPIVFAGHFSINNATMGGEQVNFDRMAEPVVDKSVFEGKDYLYVAMGHLHRYQVLSEKPLIVYCGSNNRVDFNEATEDKGFVEVSVTSKVIHKFIKVDARKFADIKYDLSDSVDPTSDIMGFMRERLDEIKDAIVRVSITLSPKNAGSYKDDVITKFLDETCYHIHGTTIPSVKREKDVKDIAGFKESMDAFEALRHYAKVKNIQDQDEFLRLGDDIIKKTKGGVYNAMS